MAWDLEGRLVLGFRVLVGFRGLRVLEFWVFGRLGLVTSEVLVDNLTSKR